jgi:hypothetical protein
MARDQRARKYLDEWRPIDHHGRSAIGAASADCRRWKVQRGEGVPIWRMITVALRATDLCRREHVT